MAQKTKVNVLREQHHLHLLHKMWRDAFSHFAIFSKYLIEMDFWSKIRPNMVNMEVFEKKRIMRACARNFFLDKSHFLILFGIIVGARSPATAPGQFSELRSAERGVPILWFNSRVPHHHAKVLILRKPHWSP